MEMLRFSEGITFGARGNFSRFEPKGWGSPTDSPTLTWTTAYVSQLRFTVQPPRARQCVHVTLTPFLGDGKLQRQDVNFYMNGLWFGYMRVKERMVGEFLLLREMFSSRENLLSISIPEAASPVELGLGADQRLLGFAFEQITFQDE